MKLEREKQREEKTKKLAREACTRGVVVEWKRGNLIREDVPPPPPP
jgi:hypothetical protein